MGIRSWQVRPGTHAVRTEENFLEGKLKKSLGRNTHVQLVPKNGFYLYTKTRRVKCMSQFMLGTKQGRCTEKENISFQGPGGQVIRIIRYLFIE